MPAADYYRVTLDVITQGHSGYAPPIMKKKYPIILTQTEREQLKDLIAAGTAPARKLTPTLASCSRPTKAHRDQPGSTRRSRMRWR